MRRRSLDRQTAASSGAEPARKSILADKLNPPPLQDDEGLDDLQLWTRATAGVAPLPPSPPPRARIPRTSERPASEPSPGETARLALQEALAVDSDVQAFYCNEYVEGGPRRWDQVLLKKLREGSFSVQAELDLHGLNQAEALTTVESFLVDCCRRKLGCVRIVHGRGNNSPGYVPVLKSRLERWLSLRRTSRYVVAYTSARPADGGAGAMYVLLRVRR